MSDESPPFSTEDPAITTQNSNVNTWCGSLRVTPFVTAFTLAVSITTFALAVTSAVQVYAAPIDGALYSHLSDYRWSIGWYIAYFTIASIVSILYALLDLTLYFFARLSPYYMGVGSTVLACGWIMQLTFWLQCDFVTENDQCQQSYLVHDDRTSLSGAIMGVNTNVTYARVSMGFVLVTLSKMTSPLTSWTHTCLSAMARYVAYLILAINAAHKKRNARKHSSEAEMAYYTTAAASSPPRRSFKGKNDRISAAVFYA